MKDLNKFLSIIMLLLSLISCSLLKKVNDPASLKNTFSKEQITLIMQGDSLKPMQVYQITNSSDSILLRTKSEDVTVDPDNPVLQNLVKRLYSTVRDSMSLGVGIAAPQAGILKKIIWVQRFDKENSPFELYLNPEIIQYSKKKQKCHEGCLSIPNRTDTLNSRSYAILIEYDKMDNTHHVEMIEDFTAIIFQHEIDHLHGILYLDHLEKELKDVTHN
ncbi:peptide deformylase [candidate division KSB1 bacterium]